MTGTRRQLSALVLLLAVGGCTSAPSEPSASSTPTGASVTPSDGGASVSPVPGALTTASTTGTTSSGSAITPAPSGGTPPSATALDRPVVSRTGTPSVSASPTSLRATVRYPDGVQLSVTKVRRAVEKGEAPGSFPGRAYVVLSLKVVNTGSGVLDLSAPVVGLRHGAGENATPVYPMGETLSDLSGSLAPGATAQADYAFAVKAGITHATLVVDLDGAHAAAVLSGALR